MIHIVKSFLISPQAYCTYNPTDQAWRQVYIRCIRVVSLLVCVKNIVEWNTSNSCTGIARKLCKHDCHEVLIFLTYFSCCSVHSLWSYLPLEWTTFTVFDRVQGSGSSVDVLGIFAFFVAHFTVCSYIIMCWDMWLCVLQGYLIVFGDSWFKFAMVSTKIFWKRQPVKGVKNKTLELQQNVFQN